MILSFGSQAGEYFTRCDYYYLLPTVHDSLKENEYCNVLNPKKTYY